MVVIHFYGEMSICSKNTDTKIIMLVGGTVGGILGQGGIGDSWWVDISSPSPASVYIIKGIIKGLEFIAPYSWICDRHR